MAVTTNPWRCAFAVAVSSGGAGQRTALAKVGGLDLASPLGLSLQVMRNSVGQRQSQLAAQLTPRWIVRRSD